MKDKGDWCWRGEGFETGIEFNADFTGHWILVYVNLQNSGVTSHFSMDQIVREFRHEFVNTQPKFTLIVRLVISASF
jgi:hypothetical protein